MRGVSAISRGVATGVARLSGYRFLPCCILSRVPLILTAYWTDFLAESEAIAQVLPPDKKTYFLLLFGSSKGSEEKMREVQEQTQKLRERYPTISCCFLCNSRKEKELAIEMGLHAVFCHQNAFLDETRYRIFPDLKKKYDAIYVARFSPIKRHLLASGVKNLKLIGDHCADDEEYFRDVTHRLTLADRVRKVAERDMPRHLGEARVGLNLASEESASFTSTEYLLCGLQVVVAGNIQGHEVLFDDSFVRVVHDTPQAVADAVMELKAKKVDPYQIRLRTIEKMKAHRQVLIDTVQAIYEQENSSRRFADHFKRAFIHKLGLRCSLPLNLMFSRILRSNRPLNYYKKPKR